MAIGLLDRGPAFPACVALATPARMPLLGSRYRGRSRQWEIAPSVILTRSPMR
jgi:hypothetical protein